MSKTLRTAAVVVGAVALAATGIGAAAGAGLLGATATAAAAGSAAAGASAIGGFITAAASVAAVATAASTALAVAAQLTTQPPPLQGNALSFNASIDAGIPYLIGRTATRGSIIYRRTHSTPGYALPDLQTFGIVLGGGGPYHGIESFAIDGVTQSFTASGDAIGAYAGWMWQTQQLGQTPESAALKVSTAKGYPPGWGAAAKLSGYCAAMWTARFDTKGKFYGAGLPKPLWVVESALVYDPRLDSSWPGGSGACRAGNEATYVYSQNPWLHALTFALGRVQNGRRVLGAGYPPVGIDIAAFVEAANVADANGWTIGGMVLSTDDKWVVLQNMAQAGGGAVIHLGARLSCVVNAPRVALATVSAADIAGEVSAAGTRSRRGRFNVVIPKFRSEAHGWEMIAASAVPVAAHIATDGGERRRELVFSLVQDLTQAQQLARYAIENSREFEPVQLPLKLRWMGYKPGDCIAANLPEIGLNGQAMIITGRSIDPESGVVTLTLRSETAGKHAFALGQTGTAPPTPSLTAPPVAPQPAALEWSIAGNGLVSGESVTPALIVTGGTALPVDGIVFEYRQWSSGLGSEDGWVTAGIQPAGATRAEITALLPGTQYQVAVSYRLGGLNGARRVLGPTATAGAGVAWTAVSGAGRPENNATNGDNLVSNAALQADASGWLLSAGVARQPGAFGDPAPALLVFQPDFAEASATFNLGQPRPLPATGRLFVRVWTLRGTGTTGRFDLEIYWHLADGSSATPAFTATSIRPAFDGLNTFNEFALTVPTGAVAFSGRIIASDQLVSFYAASGLRIGVTQALADVTGLNTAAAITGQGSLATLNAVDWASQVANKPPGFGQQTVGAGELIRKYLEPFQSVAVDGGYGATTATATFGDRSATLEANGSVFATGDPWYAGPGEANFGLVEGTYTNGATAQVVTFRASYSGAAVVPDDSKIFCRA